MRAMEDFIFRCVERALSRRQPHRIGEVSSYDPQTHSSKLIRQPEGIETGFMPHHAHHVGNGWGVLVGPQVGDQFVLGHVNGDVEVPFIAARLFSDKDKPPVVQSGEILAQHQKGHKLFFKQDGTVTLYHAAAGGNVTFDPNGNLTVDAINKTLTVNSTGTVNVKGNPVNIN